MPKPNLREAFLDAGYETIHRGGYSATGVAAIAERAGGPKGSFYNHFASKEDLAVAVLERYSSTRCIDILGDTNRAPLERIRAHFAHLHVDLAADNYEHGCMFGNFAAEIGGVNERLGAVVDSAFTAWHAALAAAIDAGRSDGSITASIDAAVTAWFLIDAWEGATLRAKAIRSSGPLDQVLSMTFGTLLTPA